MNQSHGLRFFTLLTESLLVLLLFTVTLHCSDHPWSGFSDLVPRELSLRTLTVGVLFLVAWLLCFSELRLNRRANLALPQLVGDVAGSMAVLTGLLGIILLARPVHLRLGRVFVFFWAWSLLLSAVIHIVTLLAQRFNVQREQRVVILGTGPLARRAWKEMRTRLFQSFQLVGFVDRECLPTAPSEIQSKFLGTISELNGILLSNTVDLIVLAMPAKSCYEEIQQTVDIAHSVGIELINFDPVFRRRATLSEDSAPRLVFESSRTLRRDLAGYSKRLVDIVMSASLLVLLAPLLLSIALAIKLTSPGPVLFFQERYGYRRRKFRMAKFRTMVPDAEQLLAKLEAQNEAVGPIFKMKQDPRVTKIGRLLRKTSLDELPQLWNVLTGCMSIVGPRPMSLRDVSLFDEAYLLRRFQVRPGITGLWQVSGRSNTTFDEWINLDFAYIDRWSLLLDFSILVKTIPAVLRGSGAV